MLTNPDRSGTYLVLRAHSDEPDIGLASPELPLVAPDIAQLDQHSEEHWPRGVK